MSKILSYESWLLAEREKTGVSMLDIEKLWIDYGTKYARYVRYIVIDEIYDMSYQLADGGCIELNILQNQILVLRDSKELEI